MLKIFFSAAYKLNREIKKVFLKVRLTQGIKLKMSLLKWYKEISNLVINLVICQESRSFVVVTKNVND